MTDAQSLHTASLYINNLLLSRGLLRNGRPIQFAKPHKEEGGVEATMAKVINVVHDMVLRRDKEAEQRENLALTIRTLRTNETKHTLEITVIKLMLYLKERLQTRNADSARQLSIAEGQERAMKVSLRTAENAARTLREEMLRLKTMLQQVRTQCANDVRKRDVQIQRLKTQITTQQRGTRPLMTTSSIVITPPTSSTILAHHQNREDNAIPLASPNYSLTQETTEFLTQLSQTMSDENDSLIGLVQSTLTTLKTLQGLSAVAFPPLSGTESAAGDALTCNDTAQSGSSDFIQDYSTSYETLASDMDGVLEHLRTLLTNPSFVPLEEVEVREEEISRLRDGWVKMEGRWREAVAMMEGWRKRMASGGSAIGLEEINMGLRLSPVKAKEGSDSIDIVEIEGVSDGADQEDALPPVSESESERENAMSDIDDIDHDTDADVEQGDVPQDDDDEEEEPEDIALGVGLRPNGDVLSELSPNQTAHHTDDPPRTQPEPRTTTTTTTTIKIPTKPPSSKIPRQPTKSTRKPRVSFAPPTNTEASTSSSSSSSPSAPPPHPSLATPTPSAPPSRPPKTNPPRQTIERTLAAAQREADRVVGARAAEIASDGTAETAVPAAAGPTTTTTAGKRKRVGDGVVNGDGGGGDGDEDEDGVGRAKKRDKQTRVLRRKRRSTLRPEELEALICGGVGG
ncbi:MAG: hypothetical protein M1833_005622 [Piccolia ochrophora]|nr:MAG: hypothetical protein M1833_005622 [Piccolia ochrophora]